MGYFGKTTKTSTVSPISPFGISISILFPGKTLVVKCKAGCIVLINLVIELILLSLLKVNPNISLKEINTTTEDIAKPKDPEFASRNADGDSESTEDVDGNIIRRIVHCN